MSQTLSAQAVINAAQRDNKRCFPYIARGKLNLICIRENRDVTPVDAHTQEWLANPKLIRAQTLDTISFQTNVIFKVTLDFMEQKETLSTQECEERGIPFNARESTDWMLLSCTGDRAFYDRNMERLVLMHCVASGVSVTHDMLGSLTVILHCKDNEFVAERVFGM